MRHLSDPERSPSRLDGAFGLVSAVAIYTSLFFRTFRTDVGVASIGLVPTDLVLFVLTTVAFVLLVRQRRLLTLSASSAKVLGLGTLFLGYHLVLWTKTPQPLRGVSLIFLLARDLLIVFVLTVFLRREYLPRLTRSILSVGTVIAAAMLVLFICAHSFGLSSLGMFEQTMLPLYRNGGVAYRSRWWVASPNFFGLLLLIAFFCGRTIYLRTRSRLLFVPLSIILLTILTTLSRSVIGSLLVVTLLQTVVSSVRRHEAPALVVHRVLTGAVAVVTVGALAALLTLNLVEDILSSLLWRLDNIHRFTLWMRLFETMELNPLTGSGLRATNTVIGRYVHNSYLGQLFNGGIIALGLLLAILVTALRSAVQRGFGDNLNAELPFAWALVVLFPYLFVFSFAYQPVVWYVIAVTVATDLPSRDRVADRLDLSLLDTDP